MATKSFLNHNHVQKAYENSKKGNFETNIIFFKNNKDF